MSILSFFRRIKSRYADDRAVDDFTRVLEKTKPSAFDVAMEETRRADAEVWAKLERDLKPCPLTHRLLNNEHHQSWGIFGGDVQVGRISEINGTGGQMIWQWSCGFYPGCETHQQTAGNADILARVINADADALASPDLRVLTLHPVRP